MGTTFGKSDSSATNDMLGGKVVATGTPGASTVADPNRGLDESQRRNRKLLGIGGRALGGLSDPSQSPAISGAGMPINFANNQPEVPLPMAPQSPFQNYMPLSKGARNPFFG
jgi:hypothetical protein